MKPTLRKRSKRNSGRPSARARPTRKQPLADWAKSNVFTEGGIVAWEGWVSPLTAKAIHPIHAPLISACMPSKSRGNRRWADYIHPLDKAKIVAYFEGIPSENNPQVIEYRMIDKQGAIIWVRHSILLKEKTPRGIFIRGFLSDIQKEKEYELESLRVSEREQNRIGQDLHDDLCQVLAGVSCLMRVVEDRIGAKAPEEIANLAEINQQIIEAMHRTRALTHGLFPGKILIADIRGSLLELASQIKTRFKVEISTQFVGRFPKHSPDQIIQIYRLAQEAISNSIKHGRATHIKVRLEAQTDAMDLSVSDNGTGLGISDGTEGGIGLHIMSNRASLLGGIFSLQNSPEQGVIARLRYPFQY